MMMHPRSFDLRSDQRGATIIEFALILPVLMMMLMGLFDLVYQAYAQSVLMGSVQKAARDSTIQGAANNTSVIDAKVIGMMSNLMKAATQQCDGAPAASVIYCSTRKYYDTFAEVAPEPFTDLNKNNVHDAKECFTDVNGNGVYDTDPGFSGQGGAGAVTLYTMNITYRRLFPVAKMLGMSPYQTVSSSTLLKNQPYAAQAITASTTVCP